MHILRLAALWILMTVGAPSSSAGPASTPVARHGQLRVEGNRIVDAKGAPVTLRGMSLFWSQWKPQFYNASVVRTLRDDWRADVVRVAIAVGEGGYLTNPDAEMKRARAVIDAAIRDGMYVIVDWHAHDPEPKAAIAFFTDIARRYGDRPNIIYEIWNEPYPKYGWRDVIKPYHQAVIARIRAIDPDGLIVAGTPEWSSRVDVAAADPLTGTNIAYTLHFYAASHGEEGRTRTTEALGRGVAIMATEWGTCEASGNGRVDVAATDRWLRFLERHGISHANWSITDKDEACAAMKPGAAAGGRWPVAMLTASGRLVRDRLRAAAD